VPSPHPQQGVRRLYGCARRIKKVILKLKSPPTKSSVQVQAAGDLTLAPLPLQKNPSVLAQIRWVSGQCWGATFSTAIKSDAEKFVAKSD
jgi:hypothetical protein